VNCVNYHKFILPLFKSKQYTLFKDKKSFELNTH
jgi:hypothetical protein